MYIENKRLTKVLHMVIHLAINVTTFGLTYILRNFSLFSKAYGELLSFNHYIDVLVIVCLLWPAIFFAFDLYGVKNKPYRVVSFIKKTMASGLGCLLITTILFFQRDTAVSRLFLVIFWIVNVIGISIADEAYRFILKKIFSKYQYRKKILIITSTARQEAIVTQLQQSMNYTVEVVDIISLDDGEYVEKLDELLVKQVIDEVLFALNKTHAANLQDYIMCCETMGITANVTSEFYDLPKSTIYVDKIGSIPVLKYATTPQSHMNLLVKRVFDIIGALIGLGITFAIGIFLIPAIKLESKGAAIFKQKRVGKNGRVFTLYKFRSMCNNAEELKASLAGNNEMSGAMFKIAKDPRVTKIGKFIRKTSLDELPQFWNVLIGDLSLVGTRPPTQDEVSKYQRHHWKRLSMRPGLTGIWQTSGRNKIMDFEVIVGMDSDYIENWSLLLDFKLLLKTIRVVLFGYGAS